MILVLATLIKKYDHVIMESFLRNFGKNGRSQFASRNAAFIITTVRKLSFM